MRLSKSTIIFIIFIIVLSMLLANVANILSTDYKYVEKNTSSQSHKSIPKMTDGASHLVWFLQISDIHISIFRDPTRTTQFKEFCDVTINIIKPPVVLASGDLTDAKTRDNIGSEQIEDEWKQYSKILKDTRATDRTVWLDIRGNHDNFNVINLQSKENFYSNYSIQGKTNPKSYLYQMSKNGDLYSFIAIDACLEPGPRRPFNFVGILDQTEVKFIHQMLKTVETSGSAYNIWFGHYPTSCILAEEEEGGVRALIGRDQNGLAYLCGHLHQLGGLVPSMYTMQHAGFLELELGDWKDNRMYRLLAIDHGLFSFVDIQHGDWPVVLVTNPKNSLFLIPHKEDLNVIKNSTHIRILAFSLSEIAVVELKIDDGDWNLCHHKSGPLYVREWKPSDYSKGLHKILIYVKDVHGREKYVSHVFSLDGSRVHFGLLSKFALMTNVSTLFKITFGAFFVLSILPLCVLRILHGRMRSTGERKLNFKRGCCKSWIRKLWILSTIDRIFWPLVLYAFYLLVGPWSIGYLVEDYVGIIFAWGIFVNGTFLPGSFTYAYGFLQFFTFQIPLTLILAHGVDHRFEYQVMKSTTRNTLVSQVTLHLPFMIIISVQLLMAYFFWLAYGTLAFFLGPLRTWSIILALVLWHQALILPEKCTREAARIWSYKSEPELDPSSRTLNSNIHIN